MGHFQIGYCYIDPSRGLYKFSPELYALFGRPPSEQVLTLDDIETWMAREDASALRAAHNVISLKLLPPPVTLSVLHPTGATRQLQVRFEAVRVSTDSPTFILALAKDITQSASQAQALKITNRRLKAMSELSAGRHLDSIFFFRRRRPRQPVLHLRLWGADSVIEIGRQAHSGGRPGPDVILPPPRRLTP